jgi:hypothetical protein
VPVKLPNGPFNEVYHSYEKPKRRIEKEGVAVAALRKKMKCRMSVYPTKCACYEMKIYEFFSVSAKS